ncbi:MAG: pyridoxamine 5'-phosphate oxidase family protein [Spirochaetales bacterium]|nr:MAG: pyridoxamine 5'-phosphate oxidase family protein [Spirochaetales bacterium]
MTRGEIFVELDRILDQTKTAVLGTTDVKGRPHMRWMTPIFLRERSGAVFAVTSREFTKTGELEKDNRCQWLFQTRALDTIISLNGIINLVDNSALKAEVLEAIGQRLTVFWRINADPANLIVLETIIEEASFFRPMKGLREFVSFGKGGGNGR